MSPQIIPFEVGINTSYIIKYDQAIMVDGIPFKDSSLVLEVLEKNHMKPEEIRLIILTPGHTYGSVSVLLETGDAFIGCMAHNKFPFVTKPRLPIYARDINLLKESWLCVIDQGAKAIYPGHGKSFPVEKIQKYLK